MGLIAFIILYAWKPGLFFLHEVTSNNEKIDVKQINDLSLGYIVKILAFVASERCALCMGFLEFWEAFDFNCDRYINEGGHKL